MPEILKLTSSDIELTGNKNILTPFGRLSIDVDIPSFQNELIGVVDDYNSNKPAAMQMGRIRLNRILMNFGGIPLNQALTSRFERNLITQGAAITEKELTLKGLYNRFATYDEITASSFINPLDSNEYIFYFNIPYLIQERGLKTQAEFIENYRNVWVHERHHFAQAADTENFALRMERDQNILGLVNFCYELGIPTAAGIGSLIAANKALSTIEKVKHKPISRRDVMKLSAGAIGAVVAGVFSLGTVNYLDYNLLYNNPLSFEGEANEVAKKTTYTLKNLQQTFKIEFE